MCVCVYVYLYRLEPLMRQSSMDYYRHFEHIFHLLLFLPLSCTLHITHKIFIYTFWICMNEDPLFNWNKIYRMFCAQQFAIVLNGQRNRWVAWMTEKNSDCRPRQFAPEHRSLVARKLDSIMKNYHNAIVWVLPFDWISAVRFFRSIRFVN